MTAARPAGIVPPVVTPLRPDGEVDVPSLERVVERLIGAGVHGLFALGSTGEVAYLDEGRRRTVLETVVRAGGGRVPVLAGAVDLTAARVIGHVRDAEEAGAAGVVVTAPFYAINDEAEIDRHFRAVAAATALDVWAYDIPVRVRSKLDAGLLVRLGAEGVLSGVKDSSGDDVGFRRLVLANRAAGSPLSVLTGHEVVTDGMLLLGADGAVPGLANVDPAGYVALWELAQDGRWAEVAREQDRLAGLYEITAQATGRSGDAAGVGAFKAALHHLGVIDSPAMAAPVEGLAGEPVAAIRAIVAAAGLRPRVAEQASVPG